MELFSIYFYSLDISNCNILYFTLCYRYRYIYIYNSNCFNIRYIIFGILVFKIIHRNRRGEKCEFESPPWAQKVFLFFLNLTKIHFYISSVQ